MFLAALIICFSANPTENDIHRLIDNLGNSNYQIREKSSNELGFVGRSALKILRKRIETEQDLEIKWRSQEVIDFYFRQCYEDLLPIWLLPRSYRVVDRDSAKLYYEKAREHLNKLPTNRFVKDDDYTDYNTSIKATSFYLKDLIEEGIDRADVEEIKRQMREFDTILEHNGDLYYNFHFSGDGYDESAPEEIEIIIQKINGVCRAELITP